MSNYVLRPDVPPRLTSLPVRQNERIAMLERALRSLVGIFAIEKPHRLPFAANWGNYGDLYGAAHYWRDPFGVVYLEGLVKKATAISAPDTIFTLPEGYRPPVARVFDAISADAQGRVDVRADGTVVVQTGNPIWVSLSGIHFTTIPDLLSKSGFAASARRGSGAAVKV